MAAEGGHLPEARRSKAVQYLHKQDGPMKYAQVLCGRVYATTQVVVVWLEVPLSSSFGT